MEAFPVLIIGIGVVALFLLIKRLRTTARHQARTDSPLAPEIDEVFLRPDATGRRMREAEDAVGEATPHIRRAMAERSSRPLLVLFSREIVDDGVLVVTTDESLVLRNGKLVRIDHRPGTTTAIKAAPGGRAAVDIEGRGGLVTFCCDSLDQARLVCSIVDMWAENPHVRADPRVVITPRRVRIPEEFYADTLRVAGQPLTEYNLRALHERFGMLFITRARRYLDQTAGVAVGERFTQQYGRPDDDDLLPAWPAHVLNGWRAVDREDARVFAIYPHLIRAELFERYLADPSRPLCMWRADEYENDGRGARRRAPRRGQPPIPA